MAAQKRINRAFKSISQSRSSGRIRRPSQRSMQSTRRFSFITSSFFPNIILGDAEDLEMPETPQASQNEINQLKAQIAAEHASQQAERANVARAAELRAKLERLKARRGVAVVNQLTNEEEPIDGRRFFLQELGYQRHVAFDSVFRGILSDCSGISPSLSLQRFEQSYVCLQMSPQYASNQSHLRFRVDLSQNLYVQANLANTERFDELKNHRQEVRRRLFDKTIQRPDRQDEKQQVFISDK